MTAQVQAVEQGNLFKRRAKPWQRIFLDVGMTALTTISSIFAIFVLALILYYVFTRGIERLNWQTLTQLPPPPGDQVGGFGNAVLGTIIVVSIAISITFPIGLFAAIYLSEFGKNSPTASFLRFVIKVLTGVPSIIAGVFAYGVLEQKHLYRAEEGDEDKQPPNAVDHTGNGCQQLHHDDQGCAQRLGQKVLAQKDGDAKA
jgi:phosphate transport system permease protein